MQKITKRLNEINGGKILDVATGRGEFTSLLSNGLNSFDEIIAIDNSTKAIEFSSKHNDNIKVNFKVMNALKMEFDDEEFDTVCISNSIHHFADNNYPLNEMKRVLKNNGYFIVSEMIADKNQTNAQKSHIKIHHWSAKIDRILGISHNETFTGKQLVNIVKKINLKQLESYVFVYPIENPKDEKILKRYSEIFNPMSDQVKDFAEYKEIQIEGVEILKWLNKYGFEPATIMILIGRK